MKLDLGCGSRKAPGYVGLDNRRLPGVDMIWFADKGFTFIPPNTVERVRANMIAEHCANPIFLFQEIWRVCKKGALVEVIVPYYQSVTQWKDPTHKCVITPETMRYFTQDTWYGSDYGFGVDFKTLGVDYVYLPPFDRIAKYLPFCYPLVGLARRFLWNVVHSVRITLEVVK